MRRRQILTYRDLFAEDVIDGLLDRLNYQTTADPEISVLQQLLASAALVNRDFQDKAYALRQLHEAEEAVRLAFR